MGEKDTETRLLRSEKKKQAKREKTSPTKSSRAFVFLARSLSVSFLPLQETDTLSRVESAGPKERAGEREEERARFTVCPGGRREKKRTNRESGLIISDIEKTKLSHRDAVRVLVSDPAGLGLALFCRGVRGWEGDREEKVR